MHGLMCLQEYFLITCANSSAFWYAFRAMLNEFGTRRGMQHQSLLLLTTRHDVVKGLRSRGRGDCCMSCFRAPLRADRPRMLDAPPGSMESVVMPTQR